MGAVGVVLGVLIGAVLLIALAHVGARGGWLPLHCDPALAAAERHRPPWDPRPPAPPRTGERCR